jgi:hypothetical protein
VDLGADGLDGASRLISEPCRHLRLECADQAVVVPELISGIRVSAVRRPA